MKKIFSLVFCLVMFIIACNHSIAEVEDRLNKRVEQCTVVLDEIMQMPEYSIPEDLLSKSSAIAIFPNTLKGGFIWGGRYGQGVIIARDTKTKKWSPPAFFTVGGVSWGLQIGGEAIDLILVIIGQDALDGLLLDNVTLGGDASVAAGPVGRDADASTDLLLKGGIFSYSRAKGLFAGVTIKGAIITPNNVANRTFYGEDLSSKEILLEGRASMPESAKELIETLSKYSK